MVVRVFPKIVRYFVMVLGNTFDSHKTFMDHLTISPKLREVSMVNDSDVIVAFVPIVSRAGTDIAAAMEKIPQDKPVVLVILHHTFDQDCIVPDSRLCVKNDRVFAVDCLFYEDLGLLRCPRNEDVIRAVKAHLSIEEPLKVDLKMILLIIGCVLLIACISIGGYWGGLLGGIVAIITIVYWVKGYRSDLPYRALS